MQRPCAAKGHQREVARVMSLLDGHEPQGTLIRRKDDEPDAIRKRMQVYRDQTAPVVNWYETHGGKLVHIDALGSLEDVEARVSAGLGLP